MCVYAIAKLCFPTLPLRLIKPHDELGFPQAFDWHKNIWPTDAPKRHTHPEVQKRIIAFKHP